MALTLEQIGKLTRNNIQLLIDKYDIGLAVGEITDNDYRILCGGYGELEWEWAISEIGNETTKFELCLKRVIESGVQPEPSGIALCVCNVENSQFDIHMMENFFRQNKDHPLTGRMVSLTLMASFMFAKSTNIEYVRIIEPISELNQYYDTFGFKYEKCNHTMSIKRDELQSIFKRFSDSIIA